MSVKLTFVVISLLILISFSLTQSNADTEQGVLFSEITNVVQDGVELVHPDQKTVVVQLTIEIWSTYDKTVTLEFDDVYPTGRTYLCGIRFVSSPDSSYNFNFGQQESLYHNCLYLGSFSVEPGISERKEWISAVAFTSDKNFSNELSTLEFAYTQYANNSEILLDQTYNATLIGPDFSVLLDTPPLDWGETQNSTN